jgi:DNA repair protein RadC
MKYLSEINFAIFSLQTVAFRKFLRLNIKKQFYTMETYPNNTLTIKAWAEEDRPREKLLAKGKQNLSDAELLAILLGSGSRNETAVSLAQRILKSAENNLHELGRRSLAELMKFKGIGEAKAITIAAALELGRRRQLSDVRARPQVRSSRDAYLAIAATLMDLPHEEFWILLLNRANKVMSREQVSLGGVAGTVVDAKIVFRKAIEGMASSIILVHNHPSGNLQPSQADIDLTKKLRQAGQTLDIAVLDHLIIAENSYFSFADENLI